MQDEINEMIFILEGLVEDMPLKVKIQLQEVIDELKKPVDQEKLMKIQDELEVITNLPNIDYFSRNEIMNIVTSIESIYNS